MINDRKKLVRHWLHFGLRLEPNKESNKFTPAKLSVMPDKRKPDVDSSRVYSV